MGIAIFSLILGLVIGYLWRDSKDKKTTKKIRKYKNYNERQREKIRYENDIERIKQLNLLTTNESKFMRLLQHQFKENNVIVKDKRFYISDIDEYPIAIFEYRDGKKSLKIKDKEDGIPIFLYKNIISSEYIENDKKEIKEQN